MKFAVALGVVAVAFAAAVYIHQRQWYTTACVTDSYGTPCTFQSFKHHPTWEDPVENQFGQHSNQPLTDALSTLFSSTPEAQIIAAAVNRKKDQSKRMFHTTPMSAFERSLVGPGMPRRVNVSALASAAARERSGR